MTLSGSANTTCIKPLVTPKISPPPAAKVSVHPGVGSSYEEITIAGLTSETRNFPCFFNKARSAIDLDHV